MTITTSLPKRSIAPRMARTMMLVLALLFTIANYILESVCFHHNRLLAPAALAGFSMLCGTGASRLFHTTY